MAYHARPHFTFLLCLTFLILFSTLNTDSQANGRFPASVDVKFQPGDSDTILLPSTLGLFLSKDNGQSFRWICEETIGYGGTYDPDYAITNDGIFYATTFDGLQRSTDGSCSYTPTKFIGDPTGGNAPVPLSEYWVNEVEIASDGKIWAATSTGGKSNDIYVSTDGTTFHSANNWHATAWWKSLRVSKSNPDTVYVTGFHIPQGEMPAYALFRKTTDGGVTWTEISVDDFVFGEQPNLFIEGISPTNPDIIFARVLGARAPQGDDLYRSIDGGTNFSKVLEMGGVIDAFTIRSNGQVLAGTVNHCMDDVVEEGDAAQPFKGCLRFSPDGSAGTWTKAQKEPRIACIAERESDKALFACGNNWDPDNFALARSDNSGETWNKVVRFGEITGPLECPDGTKQKNCETNLWPNLCVMLGICDGTGGDAGMGVDAGGTKISPQKDDSCLGCHSSTSAGYSYFFILLLLAGMGLKSSRGKKRCSQ